MHRLLRRQVAQHLDSSIQPNDVVALLAAVDETYCEADSERILLERSLDLTSSELLDRNERLRRDIDARSRAETALRQSEARMRAVLGALPDLLFVVSDAHVVLEWHAGAAGGYGVPGEVQPRQGLDAVFPPNVAMTIGCAIDGALADGSARTCEYQVEVDDEIRRYEARISPCDPLSVVVLVRDHTEAVRLQERLRTADRMASIGTLAAGIAHEINNPLAYVLANLEIMCELLRQTDGDREISTAGEEAMAGAKRVHSIVRDLGVFSHPSPAVNGRVDVRYALESALRMTANEIRHRARVIVDLPELPPIPGDDVRLGQVFVNLLSNAAQAIAPGRASENEIQITGRVVDGAVVVEVRDTGCGIPAGMEARILQPFVTTKPVGVGTGLGLSICRTIVTALGGEIVASQNHPRGAVFRLTLPVGLGSPAVQGASARASEAGAGGRRVLIIDDDPLVAAAFARCLKSHHVEIATDPTEGLRQLLEGVPFDVVLCDVMMPEKTGVEIYQAAVAERPELADAFVFMSGGVFSGRERDFLERGAHRRIDKPCDLAALRRLVDEHPPSGRR